MTSPAEDALAAFSDLRAAHHVARGIEDALDANDEERRALIARRNAARVTVEQHESAFTDAIEALRASAREEGPTT